MNPAGADPVADARPSWSRALVRAWWPAILLVAGLAAGCSTLPGQGPRTPSQAYASPESSALGRLASAGRGPGVAGRPSGFQLLDTAEGAFAGRMALVESAQHTLDLQYYAIHADPSTDLLLQGLREAARRGVRVRVLLDDFGAAGPDAQVLRLAFEPGVEMRLFNPLAGSRASLSPRIVAALFDFERIQKRMHNKLFIADNAWAIAGGRNLGGAYFGAGDKSNFIDLDVLAAGRIVQDMSASFDRYWSDPLAYPVAALLSREDRERLGQQALAPGPAAQGDAAGEPAPGAAPVASLPPVPTGPPVPWLSAGRARLDLRQAPLTWAPAVLLADEPGKLGPDDDEADAAETVVDGLLTLMLRAEREVLIVSPYFVPGESMMKVFAELRARKVRVRVLTNSMASNDAPAAHAGYRRYRTGLLAMGVELHELRASPQAAGDRRLLAIGSMNLDLRSQRTNSEVAVVIRSRTLAGDAARLVEGRFASGAYRVELDGDALRWVAPAGADYEGTTREPGAGVMLELLVNLLAPLAPDELL